LGELYLLTGCRAEEGDIVAVLDGGKVPVILRRIEASGHEEVRVLYLFVCIAYVHGTTDGEVEEAVKRGWVEKQDFVLA
jgi:hypothetical protein